MTSILILRKAVIKKTVLLKKLMVFHCGFSGKEAVTDLWAGRILRNVFRISICEEGEERALGQRPLRHHQLGLRGARKPGWLSGVVPSWQKALKHSPPPKTLDAGCLWAVGVTLDKESFSQRRLSPETLASSTPGRGGNQLFIS